jgi:hypothetical protein
MSTTQDSGAQATTTPVSKRVIRVADVIAMLHDGKDRDQIKAELGLSPAEARALFAHKDVAKKKVRKPVELGIEIVGLEDEEGDITVGDTPQEEVVLPQTSEELPIEAEPPTETVTPEPQAEAPAPFMAAFASPANQAAPVATTAVSGWD